MAGNDSLVFFSPLHNEVPSASAAAETTRNQRPVLDFDAGGSEAAIFSCIVPQNYTGGGITAYHWISFTSATAGSGIILGSFEAMKAGAEDMDTDEWRSSSPATFDVPFNSGSQSIISISFSDGADMDNASKGDQFRYRLQRDAENTIDDATGDMELGMIELRENNS